MPEEPQGAAHALVPGWDSPVPAPEPGVIPSPGNVPRAQPSTGISARSFIPAFFCRCVQVTTSVTLQTSPGASAPLLTQTPPELAFWGGFVLFPAGNPKPNQTKPHQTPFLHLGGALGTRRREEEVRAQPWAAGAEIGHRAGLVGPVGPAEPCPGHQTRRARPYRCPCPSPGSSSASAQLNYRSLIAAPERATQAVVARCHRGCPAPLPAPGEHLQRSQPGFIPDSSPGIRGISINPRELSTRCQTPAAAGPC